MITNGLYVVETEMQDGVTYEKRWHDAHLLNGIRELRQWPLSGVTRKTFAHPNLFSV